jgi:type I restriction enzyme R subunit
MPNEAQARLKINLLLETAGWRLCDANGQRANVALEAKTDFAQLGDNFENAPGGKGFVDYLLLDENQHPIAVLEAKREDVNPLSAKEQTRRYANSLHIRFALLSNGNIHYFWDVETGNPEPISAFPTLQSLEGKSRFVPDIGKLATEPVSEGYLAEAQLRGFSSDPDYIAGGETRLNFLAHNKLKLLRHYQVEAIHAIQKSAKERATRFLLEMATGTGKTLVCAAIIRLFLETGNARRVLFLVDRLELEDQAQKAFQSVFSKTRNVQIFKKNKDTWGNADILVSTIQSFQKNDRYRTFSPTDFDLVISDEAHRSISGNARAVFEWFNGFKIGLTATPKDYLKNVREDDDSTREFEKRQLRDTYKTFGCESGEPTYRYDLSRGVQDGFLVNPALFDIRTEITTQLLSDSGYSIHKVITDEDGEEHKIKETFIDKNYEKQLFNERTNVAMCEAFLQHGRTDPVTGEFGKSILFAVSQNHAAKLVSILNQFAMKRWPGKYDSDFAVQITSNVQDAQHMSVRFAENDLLGNTRWRTYYKSSRARVAVTVAMMTTGYDCPDLLNLGFMRPVFSPSDFIQMKGRGTRLYTFRANYDADGNDLPAPLEYKKEGFNLLDFFAVCEYFEEKYDYTEPLPAPEDPSQPLGGGGGEPHPPAPTIDIGEPDAFLPPQVTELTSAGMKIDQQMFGRFREQTQQNEILRHLYETDKEQAMEYLKNELFEKPNFFMNLEKIRRAFNLDRGISLREALDILLNNAKPKTKQQFIRDKFNDFIAAKHLTATFAQIPTLFQAAFALFDAYISSPKFQDIIDKKALGRLDETTFSIADYKTLADANVAVPLVRYIRDYINISKLRETT